MWDDVAEHVMDVVLDRGNLDVELDGDLLVGESPSTA
jgi:hypothetical protein